MTAAFLQSELLSLISDSKRKQNDVRVAAEKSLADVKAIHVTSETQLAGDLLRRPQFIDPFVLACHSKYPKLAITATACLQRLVATRSIPRGRLSDVLDAFRQGATQGQDVQLKILQALPSLLQLYAAELHGDPLSKILSLCGRLAGSKSPVVSNTAAATFQQLVASVLERGLGDNKTPIDEHSDLDASADDVSRVFTDMCSVVKGEDLQFIQAEGLSLRLALEVIEDCVSNKDIRVLKLPQCAIATELQLIPGIVSCLDTSNNMVVFAQGLRIIRLLVVQDYDRFSTSLSGALYLILTWLDRGTSGGWRRVLCLEMMKDICSNFQVLRSLYSKFDLSGERKAFIQELLASLVRIASESPVLIGLGRQSTMPSKSTDDNASSITSAVDAPELDAVGSVTQANTNVTGVSTQWSTTPAPLLELLERISAPEIPSTYIYTQVLACVAAISDGLSKYVMPFSLPPRNAQSLASAEKEIDVEDDAEKLSGRKASQHTHIPTHHRLLNPLTRDNLINKDQIQVCAKLIENCWPAILATCSTFLNSALDSHFYHILVRTVQKLTQVSGVLELNTPRDAFLTTLAKVCVPLNAATVISLLYGNKTAKIGSNQQEGAGLESVTSPTHRTPKVSVDLSSQTLNVRNLLCLRALLNLGIALGPTLSQTSWFIVIQAQQQVEALMSVSPTVRAATAENSVARDTDADHQSSLATEIAAVNTAAKRLIESTRSYSDSAFEVYALSVFKLIDDLMPPALDESVHEAEGTSKRPSLSPESPKGHRSTRSISGALASSSVLITEAEFVLKTVTEVSRVNLHRFIMLESKSCTWDLIAAKILGLVAGRDIDKALRLQAASTLDIIVMEATRLLEKQDLTTDQLDDLQQLCLTSMLKQLDLLYIAGDEVQDNLPTDIEIHRRLLEALENIVSHSGESLKYGWRIVFEILILTVKRNRLDAVGAEEGDQDASELLLRTIAPAFRTVQLVISDFLTTIDPQSSWILVQLLALFGRQTTDLNISLATTTLYWNINALLLQKSGTIDVAADLNIAKSPVGRPDSVNVSDASTLWFGMLTHLGEVCRDERIDVRNGALRVLVRIFDASGEQMSPEMWNLCLRKAIWPMLNRFAMSSAADLQWQESFLFLLQGTVRLIVQYADSVLKARVFHHTWDEMLLACKSMLEQKTLPGHTAIFNSTTQVVNIMSSLKLSGKALLTPLLRLWLQFHPADIELDGPESNGTSEAFASHAQTLSAIKECGDHVFLSLIGDVDPKGAQLMASIKRTIFDCLHGRYSSDVNKLSPEQEASLENIRLLRVIETHEKVEYTRFVLDLIELASVRNANEGGKPVMGRSSQLPTLVMLVSSLIQLLNDNIPVRLTSSQWVRDYAAAQTLAVLTTVIRTKYTNIPVSSSAPAWQVASLAAVGLLKALQKHTEGLEPAQTRELAISIPLLAEAILDATALKSKEPQPSSEIVAKDEAFDQQCFSDFHHAVLPLMLDHASDNLDRRRYALTLFRASLVAEVWYDDFTTDLLEQPLADLNRIRHGTICKPELHRRQQICLSALDHLFSLMKNQEGDTGTTSVSNLVAKAAAPYFILRVAHTIKTFIADQGLRQLNPPEPALQSELRIVLEKAWSLKCNDETFSEFSKPPILHDGQTHLRLLYTLILKLKLLWNTLPRLENCPWQDDKDGRIVAGVLEQWGEAVARGWSVEQAIKDVKHA